MSRLSLYLMGPLWIELDGETVKLDSHKAIALLVKLALSAQSHPRDALINLLWPERDASQGHTNLRHTLYLLRKALPADWLQADRETIRFDSSADFWLDVHQFHSCLNECLTHGHPAREVCPACVQPLTNAIALYRGDFLMGFGLKDSLEFDNWQLIQTETLRREFAEGMRRLVKYHSTHGAFEVAIEAAGRWLALDRLNEEVHCQLMRLYTWSGQRSLALQQYQNCVQILQDELQIPPQPATTALYQVIVKGELSRPAAGITDGIFPVPVVGIEPAEAGRKIFVARQSELASLYRRLDLAVSGHGQVVFIIGDAGSGKTALLQEFAQRALERRSDMLVAGGNCNACTGEGDPYLPFREILGLLTGDIDALWTAGSIHHAHARRLWDAFPLVVSSLVENGPDLLNTLVPATALLRRAIAFTAGGLSEHAGLMEHLQKLVEQKNISPNDLSLHQDALFEQYARVLISLARERPLLLVMDDLQWADTASIGLLFHLGRRLAGQRILIAGAYRSEEVSIGRRGDRHPLEVVLHDLQRTFGDIFIDLQQAEGRQFVEQYLATEPNRLSASFHQTLYHQTAGHPLFTVELLRGMQERGELVKDGEGYWVEGESLDWGRLPSRVEAVIAERIARLDASSRELLEIASVEGETFTAEVVARVISADEQETVKCLSAQMDRRHRLIRAQEIQHLGTRRLSRYRFQHILYQNYLYASLDPVRLVYLHEAVGSALELLYGQDAQAIAVPLARHFHAAGLVVKAIGYLLAAGKRARQSSANTQAIAYLNQGLELIYMLPDTPERARWELEYRLTLGVSQVITLGHAAVEVKTNYERARELSTQAGDVYQRFQALMGLRRFYHVGGNLVAAQEVGEQILAHAHSLDAIYLARAYLLLAETLYRMGSFQKAQEHYERCSLAFESAQCQSDASLFGNDTLVINQVFQGENLWYLGFPDQALKIALLGLERARQLAHPFTLACALCITADVHNLRREMAAALQKLEDLLPICLERGFILYTGWGTVLLGQVLVAQNRVDEGIAQIQGALADWKATGAGLSLPGFLANLAEAYMHAGRYEEGLRCIQEAFTCQVASSECFFQAELDRMQGKLLQVQGGTDIEAEECFQRALCIARAQKAHSLELRAALDLSRLWHTQGKTALIPDLLSQVVGRFTEGFTTPDLQDAILFLEQVSQV